MGQRQLTYVLPALDINGPMDAPKAAGSWLKIERLDALAESLKVGVKSADREGIKSIPDPWAQPLLFERSLLDTRHPLHDHTRQQWRGILTTLALQVEFKNYYTLSIETLPIDAGSRFRRVLKELQPAGSLHPQLRWDEQSLIVLREQAGGNAFAFDQGRTIGMLSPSVIVSGVQGGQDVRSASVPWMVNGLTCPTRASLSARHFRIVANYVNRLAAGLQGAGELDNRIRSKLFIELKTFYEDCVARANDGSDLRDQPLALDWPTQLHQALLGTTSAYEARNVAPEQGDAVLRTTTNLTKVARGAILVDEQLSDSLRLPPEDIRIWGQYSLAEALKPHILKTIRVEAEEAGWLVITPDDIFSQALVGFDASTRIEAHYGDFTSVLLPLTPLALLLVDPADLPKVAQLQKGPKEATAVLQLKLSNGQTHTVRKTLEVLSSETPGDLSFWPNFKAPGWQWTYFHFSGSPTYQVRPRFAVTGNFIAEEVNGEANTQADRVRRLRRWFEPGIGPIDAMFGFAPDAPRFSEIRTPQRRLMQRVGYYATEQSIGEMHHLTDGADAIFFARQKPDGEYDTVGMALVRFQEPSSASVGDTTMAVDFGTTNTVIYRRRGSTIDRVDFEDRVLFPFGVREKEEKRRQELIELYTTFFPLKAHQSPFPTVVKLREFRPALPPQLQQEVDAGKIESHGLTDAVFFVPNFDGFLKWHSKLTPGENPYLDWTERGILKFRLKWGDTAPMRAMAARFLRQVMMMTAAETVATGGSVGAIDWRFSYPQAFKPRERAQLEKEIAAGWRELFGDTAPPVTRPFLHKAEGLAAGHYYLRQNERTPDRLMVILDIGGGTTDIAIWKDDTPIWRNSVKVAGGHFFTSYLANNIDLLRDIDLSDVAEGLSKASKLDEDGRRDFVELFVNKPNFNDKFASGFRRLSAAPLGEGLRQVAFVALGGMMYYVGLVLKRLVESPDAPISADDLSRMTVGFAGRGSSLYQQLSAGVPDDELEQVLKIAVRVATGKSIKGSVSARFPGATEAKHEVAKGLLVDVPASSTDTEQRFAILGEKITSRGETHADTDELFGIKDLPDFDDIGLENLQDLLAQLREAIGLSVDIKSRGALDELRKRARSHLRTSLALLEEDAFEDRDAQPFEPPFILALRELIRFMTQEIDRRDEILLIKDVR
ncbi:hypothetical protein OB03_07285 [Brevundimonas sp. GN22]